MDIFHGGCGYQRFFVGIDKRFVINRRIGLFFIQHHAAIGTDDGSGIFQNDQIFADSGACCVKVLGQFFNRAFSLFLQVLQNRGLTLTRFHRRDYPDLSIYPSYFKLHVRWHDSVLRASP